MPSALRRPGVWGNHCQGGAHLSYLTERFSHLTLDLLKALRVAHEDPLLYRPLLKSVSGAILFATPHDSSGNKQFWQYLNYAFQGLLSSRKRRGISAEDCGLLTHACLGFEQARVRTSILSLYETEVTRLRTSSIAPTKAIHVSCVWSIGQRLFCVSNLFS